MHIGIAITLAALTIAPAAAADPLLPDPPPAAHHAARTDWTYSYDWHTRDGRKVHCVVPAHGKRHCAIR